MTNKMINSAQAPATVGPYSHSVLAEIRCTFLDN